MRRLSGCTARGCLKAVLYEVVQRPAAAGHRAAGQEVPVEDELPTVPGLQVSLARAGATLSFGQEMAAVAAILLCASIPM